MAINPANYQDYMKKLNVKLPNMPASTGAQPPATPSGGVTPPSGGNTLTPGYMQQPKPAAMPMAAPQAQSPVNMPQFTPSQTSARDWINNPSSGQGGIDAYTATQNQRYADAYKTGDQDLLGRLQNDSQRVGYSLNMPQAAPAQPQAASAPPPSTPAPYGQMSPDQIKAEAQARIAKQVADRTRIANQTKAGYQTSFDRMNQNIGEDRTLENVQNQRNLNPFSGHSDYAQGMIARDRGKQDLQNQQDLQTRLGGVDSQLSDFLNQTPEQQQQIINDLTRQERDYGLQVGTLTGNLQGYGRTLAGSAQDANYTGMYQGQQTMQAQNQSFNQGIAEGQLTGQYNGQSTLAGKQANWNAYQDAIGMTGNLGSGPKDNWNQLPDQTGSPSYKSQQDDLQNEWKLSEQSGVISNKIADKYGIPRGTPTEAAKQFAMNNNLQTDKYHSDVDQSLFDYMNKAGQPAKGQTVSDISSNISRSLSALGDNVDISTPQGKQQIESMIISQTHDPLTAVPLYNMYGIPIPSQLKQEYEAALKKGTP